MSTLYVVIDWGGHDRLLGSDIMQQTGSYGPWCPVPAVPLLVPLEDSSQAPGGLLCWP